MGRVSQPRLDHEQAGAFSLHASIEGLQGHPVETWAGGASEEGAAQQSDRAVAVFEEGPEIW